VSRDVDDACHKMSRKGRRGLVNQGVAGCARSTLGLGVPGVCKPAIQPLLLAEEPTCLLTHGVLGVQITCMYVRTREAEM
jgi:hypothetical protein